MLRFDVLIASSFAGTNLVDEFILDFTLPQSSPPPPPPIKLRSNNLSANSCLEKLLLLLLKKFDVRIGF